MKDERKVKNEKRKGKERREFKKRGRKEVSEMRQREGGEKRRNLEEKERKKRRRGERENCCTMVGKIWSSRCPPGVNKNVSYIDF